MFYHSILQQSFVKAKILLWACGILFPTWRVLWPFHCMDGMTRILYAGMYAHLHAMRAHAMQMRDMRISAHAMWYDAEARVSMLGYANVQSMGNFLACPVLYLESFSIFIWRWTVVITDQTVVVSFYSSACISTCPCIRICSFFLHST